MNALILILIILNLLFTILLAYTGYTFYQTYSLAMDAIVSPNCPATKCVCESKICDTDCSYNIKCAALGYCPACERSYLEELETCQRLLEDIENYD